jgi:ATP-binding cassette subfamily C protein
LSSLVFQYLNGITKIRIASAENRAFANWAERYAHVRRLGFNSQHISNIEQTFTTGYAKLITASIFAAFGFLLTKQESAGMSAGNYIAFNAAFGAFFGGLSGMVHTALALLNLVPVYERAKPILHAVPEANNNLPDPGELQGEIEVANVSFEYSPGLPVLKIVSFVLNPGEYVALVGPSGSGKSTLLRLMLGFENPTAGSIRYDGQDMTTVDVGALRRQLGVVLQSGKLMSGDIFSNIVGITNLTQDDAWEAARMVGLDTDIEQMPMGMFTVISDGASTFSGGQRQRIMIARAVVHRPRILFFDEATSALDNRTQAIVTQSLDRMKSTRVVIAHRLSTVVNADRIIVLDQGEIVQDGRYAELIAQPGLFQELARRQVE